MKNYTVDVIIPTYKPGKQFHKLMQILSGQDYPIHSIRIMNTEKKYFPEAGIYEKMPGVEVHHLSAEEFNHGGTRDRAATMSDTDILLFMTQDAMPKDEFLVSSLVKAFDRDFVGAAYARQLPNEDCKIIERYTRSFNYGDKSVIKSKDNLPAMGIKTFFCSNVCAAYRRDLYLALGGFEKHTIFNEDMIMAGKMIQSGREIAYVAEAMVYHSHNYGNIMQFKRNFDLAVSQADHPQIFSMASSESEGMRMVKQTAAYLIKIHKPWLIPDLVMKSGFKYLGYFFGKRYRKLPRWLVLKCTMSPNYWTQQQSSR